MARQSEADRVDALFQKIRSGAKVHEDWSKLFQTDRLEKYYEGCQWRGYTDEEAEKKYVINLVFSSMETNKPSLIFYNPKFKIEPKPGRAETWVPVDPMQPTPDELARRRQYALQTKVDDPDLDFMGQTSLALQEAHFRFGVIEVGYSGDFIDNPNAQKPIEKDGKPLLDSDGKAVLEPDKIAQSENVYFKWIPASTFNVSISSKNRLSENDMVWYWEWEYVEDLKANKNLNTNGMRASGTIKKGLQESTPTDEETERRAGMTKVFHVWDLRKRVRHIVAEGFDKFLVEAKPYSFLPFAVIKFYEKLNSFYPIPPVFNWLGPQDEINEVREAQKAHRTRFYRRYTYQENSIEDDELKKLETGGPGVYAKSKVPSPLTPVADAPMGSDVWQHLDESRNDFVMVSGVAGESRGIAESDTATQANLIDVRSRIREMSARNKVSTWLSEIGRLALMTIMENMTLPMWIKENVDPFTAATSPEAVMQQAEIWQQITSEDLGDIDMDVSVDLSSMSPVTEDIQRQAWNTVLTIIKDPSLAAILSASPAMLRKTLSMYGIRSEAEIREIQRVLGLVVSLNMATVADSANPKSAGSPPSGPRPGTESNSPAPPIASPSVN